MEFSPVDKILISVNDLAKVFGVTDRAVQIWAQNEGMPKEDRGSYDLIACTQWRIEKLNYNIEILRSSGDEKIHAQKLITQKIINQERIAKFRKLIGELVDYDAVRIAWVGETKIFRKALNAMVPKLVAALQNITNNDKKRELINKEVREVLNMIGELKIDTKDDEFENDDSIQDPGEEITEDELN